MIRRILLVRCAPADAAALADQFAVIDGLRPRLSGLLAVSSGPSRSPEDLERGYTHGLVADFADREALLRYAADAEHRSAGARITELAVGGVDGLLVVDLELADLELAELNHSNRSDLASEPVSAGDPTTPPGPPRPR